MSADFYYRDPQHMTDAELRELQSISRGEWRPTPAEFIAYKKREVELCIQAIRSQPGLRQTATLFSLRTWEAATRMLGDIERSNRMLDNVRTP